MKKQTNIVYAIASLMIVIVLMISIIAVSYNKSDDWQYDPLNIPEMIANKVLGGNIQYRAATTSMAEGGIGYSVGGSKDINNFRENIENNYFPIYTDLTYEGLYYDYYFNTGNSDVCNDLFCPSYSHAISNDPFSNEEEYYMTVGLNSGIQNFERKKLNLVIVLDISGSMSSAFNRYYYDDPLRNATEEDMKSKMQIANEAVVLLTEHLNEDDRFGVVLFDNGAYLAKPLSLVEGTDMDAIRDHILEITPQGGTNMAAGMSQGTELFNEFLDIDKTKYENRIIFLTDAMPNLGETSRGGLFDMIKNNSDNSIYTTFIGIGVDFNTDLVESLTKIKGANYYSVHNSGEFKDRMDEGFEYMVSPLVFDLQLTFESDGWEIEKVYGSPEADESTGRLMKVNTLFPSRKQEEGVKGGVILLRLKRIGDNDNIRLEVSYEDREGNQESNEVDVSFPDEDAEYFENIGIRKAVLLARYANLAKTWIQDDRGNGLPRITPDTGIIIPDDNILGEWERQSVPLRVSDDYKELFEDFYEYFEQEMNSIGDSSLSKELDIINKLADY